jgi:hypothetical protein
MTEQNCFEIKTHKIGRTYNTPHFYILNKGLNSGRPMNQPCPNCFTVSTQTDKQRESLYYLCQSLQIGEYFKFYIIGSVIPFIRIDDVRKVLNTAIRNYKQQQWELKVQKLKQISAYEENLKLQLKTISDLKIAVLRS